MSRSSVQPSPPREEDRARAEPSYDVEEEAAAEPSPSEGPESSESNGSAQSKTESEGAAQMSTEPVVSSSDEPLLPREPTSSQVPRRSANGAPGSRAIERAKTTRRPSENPPSAGFPEPE